MTLTLRHKPVIMVSALEYVETPNAGSLFDKLTTRQALPGAPRSGASLRSVIRRVISYALSDRSAPRMPAGGVEVGGKGTGQKTGPSVERPTP